MGTSTSQQYRHQALLIEEVPSGRMMVVHWHGKHYESFSVHGIPDDYWLLAYTSYDWDRLDRACRQHRPLDCKQWSLATLEELGVPTAAAGTYDDTVVYNRLWCVTMQSRHNVYILPNVGASYAY